MNLTLTKEEKLVLYQKYKKSGMPIQTIKKRIKEINNDNHKLTIERNNIKKSKKKDIMEFLS